MARKQSYSHSELLNLTKRLVLEHGYDGFNLKLLSQHLPGARSTIYQYFANKDEIVAACMKRVTAGILEKASALDESDAMQALQELLGIYLEEYQLHQLLSDAYKIKTSNSEAARRDIEFVEEAHDFLKVQLTRLFQKAQQEGKLREDIPLPVHVGVFFNLINTPNMMSVPLPQWSKMLFEVWMGGAIK
ncbi:MULTISPECIES: TetR/AcrR family transcriptional regulator [Paenibacillus]|uniref:TetR/AcrR family transcriptional regulator n=1 Tax=Paenibacillus TaxID=44249 RepID=UPI00073F7199|nr:MULTISPECIES: TetR/AcrR family transcriptional regulator [Paenibacillus]MDU4694443.1 TetR/AcrR family transcriptional regulator [Paenibacillus sp.]